MDFIRAVTKAIFYDFPETEARKMLLHNYTSRNFEQTIYETLSLSNPEYSRTETKRIWELARDRWILLQTNNQEFNPGVLFNILPVIGSECLDISEKYPKVRFENLLRWRNISYFISEDLITIPYLALNDLERALRANQREFDWPDVLEHDNVIINKIIAKGLADTHAHLFASSDIFTLNWVAMMNNPRIIKQKLADLDTDDFMDKHRFSMEREVITITGARSYSFYQLGLLATLCRAFLFTKVNENTFSDYILNRILNCLDDLSYLDSSIYDIINILRMDGIKSIYGSVADYAISGSEDGNHDSPYYILVGERKLLYDVFRLIFSKSDNSEYLEKILFLYIILKNRIRREIVQTHKLIGFENFQIYQSRKTLFLEGGIWSKINLAYAVYSSLGIRSENSFECRITPNTIKDVLNHSVCNPFSIFGNKESLRKSDVQKYKPISDQFSIVIHFIKKSIPTNKPNRREALRKYRATLWTETDTILKAKRSDSRITGIDVAGSELNCRPEIFSPMFRWAKSQGIGNNMTYHAGEDFYDILDGLRTIHEAIIFMDFDAGCRIGHAIAIGKDPHKYYIERHHTIIAPAQIILDNLIWMRYFATELGIVLSHETQNFIDKTSYDLFFNIGYDVNNHLDYWHSMLMRGNDINYWEHDWNQSFTTRRLTARPLFWKNNNLVETQNAINLYKTYELNDEVYRNGLKPYQVKTPLSFANDVSRLQDGLMRLMRTSGIAIEANPSSNLKIGGMDKYEDLPLFRLFPFDENNENRMLVSINTDDRGVFATNLANEYSLIAASLIKQKDVNTGKPLYSITQIADYIRCIAENGKFMRFR